MGIRRQDQPATRRTVKGGLVRPGSADEKDDAECGQDHRDQDRDPEAPDVSKHQASIPFGPAIPTRLTA
jgi:hypothetical protein